MRPRAPRHAIHETSTSCNGARKHRRRTYEWCIGTVEVRKRSRELLALHRDNRLGDRCENDARLGQEHRVRNFVFVLQQLKIVIAHSYGAGYIGSVSCEAGMASNALEHCNSLAVYAFTRVEIFPEFVSKEDGGRDKAQQDAWQQICEEIPKVHFRRQCVANDDVGRVTNHGRCATHVGEQYLANQQRYWMDAHNIADFDRDRGQQQHGSDVVKDR